MMRKITLLFLACLGMHFAAKAQFCGFDQKHHNLLNTNPVYSQKVQAMDAQWSQLAFLQNNLGQLVVDNTMGAGKVYEIPVVVHVIHTGGPIGSIYNPTDGQITAMIDYLTQSFAAMWVSYPDSMSGGTSIPIRFVLAKRDTACNATTGITRDNGSFISEYASGGVELSTTTGADETLIKNISRWDPTRYYNIWIVNMIDGEDGAGIGTGPFTAGYAYLPPAPSSLDGTIMLASQSDANEITLVHEIGHALGLYHVFEGGDETTCPDNFDCNTDGDLICDTDPQMQSQFNCPTGTNPCTGTPFGNAVHNFMDYSSCQDRFTPGQRSRMINTLLQFRGGLIGSLGGTPVTTSPGLLCTVFTSTPGNTFDAGPRRVRIKDVNYTYLNYASGGFNGDNNQAFIDRFCTQGAILEAGTVDTILVNTGGSPQYVRVYIDYNNDGDFQDANELVWTHQGTTNNETHTLVYNVPTLADVPGIMLCTPLRMRVVADRVAVGAPPTECSVTTGQGEDYAIIIRANGTGGGTGTVANTLLTNNPSCPGDAITFVATPSVGISGNYQWFINNVPVSGATNDTFITSTPVNNDAVTVRIYYATTCSTDSATSNAITVLRSNAVPPTVTIALTGGTNPSCATDSLTFSVTSTGNAGTNPTYQWQVDGVNVPGATNDTFISNTIPHNSIVTVIMTSNSVCAVPTTATSNAITVLHGAQTPVVSIALVNGNNPGCPGQVLTFLATPVNAGNASDISYQWHVNGINSGSNSPTFTGIFNNGDVIDVTITTTSSCATTPTANSNQITIIYSAVTQTVTITNVTGMPICSGRPVLFTSATINSGNGPSFQWQINGVNVPGATAPNFTTTTLNNGDLVTLVVTSTDICVGNQTAVSNTIIADIIPSSVPTISISILQGFNPGCIDSTISFQGNVTNLGSSPDGNWYVNDTLVGTGFTFTTANLDSGDVVKFVANQTDGACYTSDTVEASMVMELYETPEEPILSLIGNMLFVNNNQYNYYDWFGPNGIIPGEHTQWYHPLIPGNYYVIRYNGACGAPMSNIINISLLDVKNMEMAAMKVYPNPTNGLVTLDWGSNKVNRTVDVYNAVGQKLMSETVDNQSKTVVNLQSFANGVYFLAVKDAEGATQTIRITLTK